MKVVLLVSYSSMKKKLEWFGWFLTQKIDFESQNFGIFMARFLIGRWSAKDLLQWESAIYHSSKLGFEGPVAKKFLNGIYCIWMVPYICNILVITQLRITMPEWHRLLTYNILDSIQYWSFSFQGEAYKRLKTLTL